MGESRTGERLLFIAYTFIAYTPATKYLLKSKSKGYEVCYEDERSRRRAVSAKETPCGGGGCQASQEAAQSKAL